MLKKSLVILLFLTVGVTTFFVFHHPPMRLMQPPLLFQGESARVLERAQVLEDGSRLEIFYATNRLPIGPRRDRIYTVVPGYRLLVGRAVLTIGEDGSTLDQLVEWSTRTDGNERPYINLGTMTEYATLVDGEKTGKGESPEVWFAEIDAALAKTRTKAIQIYVHGANTTVERAAGQASQLHHYSGRRGIGILFAWPTAENFLRYSSDIRSAFSSAPYLVELIAHLAQSTTARHIDLFTYSAGATVGSDGLALLARTRPEIMKRIGEVYHAAPDVDFRTFVNDLKVYSKSVRRVTIAVNLNDSALRISKVVNRASRAGRPDLGELSSDATKWLLQATVGRRLDILNVKPDMMPELAATSHTFWYDDPWVSNDLLLTLLFHLSPTERVLNKGVAENGNLYWTFPPDYPDRMITIRDVLRARLE